MHLKLKVVTKCWGDDDSCSLSLPYSFWLCDCHRASHYSLHELLCHCVGVDHRIRLVEVSQFQFHTTHVPIPFHTHSLHSIPYMFPFHTTCPRSIPTTPLPGTCTCTSIIQCRSILISGEWWNWPWSRERDRGTPKTWRIWRMQKWGNKRGSCDLMIVKLKLL